MIHLEDKTIVFFDGDCALCSRVVRFLMQRDKNRILYFAPLQGEVSQDILQLNTETFNTIYLQSNSKIYKKSTAALKAIASLGGIWSLSKILLLVPPFVRDSIYDLISRNRKTLFRSDCRIPNREESVRILM